MFFFTLLLNLFFIRQYQHNVNQEANVVNSLLFTFLVTYHRWRKYLIINSARLKFKREKNVPKMLRCKQKANYVYAKCFFFNLWNLMEYNLNKIIENWR